MSAAIEVPLGTAILATAAVLAAVLINTSRPLRPALQVEPA
ncbi:MAG: hypothetical protein ACR2MZ_00830 [Candidatus Dormibacter sp.]